MKVNNEGLILGIRPGFVIIKAFGLDNINTEIKVLSVSKEGLLKNYILDLYNANKQLHIQMMKLYGEMHIYLRRDILQFV